MAMTCLAITKGGTRCRVPALTDKQHCLMHDPESADLRRAASVKGGKNRSAKARAAAAMPEAMDSPELLSWLSLLFRSVMAGKVEPRVGTAAATIARTISEIRTTTELEERLAQLETAAGLSNDHRRFG